MARPFVICFVARSGSTAIKHDLAQHPQIEMRAEAMGGRQVPAWPGPRALSDDNRLGWVEHHWRPELAAEGVAAGFKLQLNLGAPQFDDLDRLAAAFLKHRPAIYRLGRTDRVRHAVGALRAAELRKLNAETSGRTGASIVADSAPPVKAFAGRGVVINPAAFRRMAEALARNTAYLDDFTGRFAGVVQITYEDYLADRLAVLNTICAHAGVDRFAEAPPQILHKISSNDLREAVANYDEIAEEARRLGLAV
jgi:LPS sulfotransferase NodH